ncbi:MAG: hypothetical protein ACUVX8_10610 [Candidatus Zipacnadales bacterium]
MTAACILAACFLLGAQLLTLCRPWRCPDSDLSLAERALFALGAGILVQGLLVLGVGLMGLLRPWVLLVLWVAVVAVSHRQVTVLIEVLRTLVSRSWHGLIRPSKQRLLRNLLALWAIFTLLAALAPPSDFDYDGLSQHLAIPKVYLRDGRIHPLWYDHHSQFPLTLQMLFALGVAVQRPEAAKVIHWACGIAAALTLVVAGRRLRCSAAGEWAALAVCATPIVGWLSTVAYVDLGSLFFATLLLLALLRWLASRDPSDLMLAGIAAAGGLSVKMQGLQLFAVAMLCVVATGLFNRQGWRQTVRSVALFGAVAIVLASPWYVKSYLWTGNPVYPFAYGIFGGKYWGPAEAAQYRAHQLAFGIGEPPSPQERQRMPFVRRIFSGPREPLNLLLAPWNLAMYPAEFDVVGINPFYALTSGSIGPLFLALLPLSLLTRPPTPIRWSLVIFVFLWVSWLLLMQYNRYLVLALPFAALPVGYLLAEGLADSGPVRLVARGTARVSVGLALLYLAVNGLLGGTWAAGLGLIPVEEYLTQNSECYRVAMWTNRLLPPSAKIALYAEPRGFYFDRQYLWADPGHSRLIEYDKLTSAEDLLDAYAKLGITHLLYHCLPGAPELFAVAPYGPLLKELYDRGLLRIVGRPSSDPNFVLLVIDTPWARELLQ